MKPYSKEFRGEVLAACDRGRSTRELATYFNVSESWMRRVKEDLRDLNKVVSETHDKRRTTMPGLSFRPFVFPDGMTPVLSFHSLLFLLSRRQQGVRMSGAW